MAKSPNWTKHEIVILQDKYPVLGANNEILEFLPGRNLKGINIKASRLGLKVLNPWNKKLTTNTYREKLASINSTIDVLGEYILSGVAILHKCKLCNIEWLARPDNIMNSKSTCPKCATARRAETNTLDLEEVLFTMEVNGFKLLSEYTHSKRKIKVEHISCGYVWETIYNHIQQGSGCPICNIGFGYGKNKENIPDNAYIYLFNIVTKTESFLKIGITSLDISHRTYSLHSNIPGILSIRLEHLYEDSGLNILLKEKAILQKFTKHYTELVFPGYTELLALSNNIEDIKKAMNGN